MVVCRFYLQGCCKFGSSCRYEHSSSDSYGSYEGEYFQNRYPPSYNDGKISQELQEIVKSVQDDIVLSEKGGQWPVSCYSPFKQRPCIPEWQDLSPEEMRWMIYQAAQTGNVDTCKLQVKNILRNCEIQKAQILNPTPEVYSLLEKIYKGEINNPTSFSFIQSANSSDTGLSSSPPVFGGGQSASVPSSINNFTFALPPQLDQGHTKAVFGTSPPVAQNIIPQQSVFGNAVVQQGNVFASGSVPASTPSTIFGGSPQYNNAFGRQDYSEKFYFEVPPVSIAGSADPGVAGKNVFESSSGSIPSSSVSNPSALSSEDACVYSLRSELTEEDITQFMNPTFSITVGKIPTKPPTKDLCIM